MLDSKRREFIALLGGGGLLLAAKVRRARGQQPAMRRIGVLMGFELATAQAERIVAGGKSIEVAHVKITEAGRRASGKFEKSTDGRGRT